VAAVNVKLLVSLLVKHLAVLQISSVNSLRLKNNLKILKGRRGVSYGDF
jgi:hypothetical protein